MKQLTMPKISFHQLALLNLRITIAQSDDGKVF